VNPGRSRAITRRAAAMPMDTITVGMTRAAASRASGTWATSTSATEVKRRDGQQAVVGESLGPGPELLTAESRQSPEHETEGDEHGHGKEGEKHRYQTHRTESFMRWESFQS
jgi:hypothetical protein